MASTHSSQAFKGSHDASFYQSPYRIALAEPQADLLKPDSAPPRDNWRLESSSSAIRRVVLAKDVENIQSMGSRGSALSAHRACRRTSVGVETAKSLGSLRRRAHWATLPNIITFQSWDPPKNWPWKKVTFGRNSKGMDCSDFSSWIYNYGLGLKLPTGITKTSRRELCSNEKIKAIPQKSRRSPMMEASIRWFAN